MTALPLPPGLTAGDAEWFEAQAAQKRATLAECPGADPAWLAELAAEAAGLDALAAALRDPAARGMPAPAFGRGGEAAPAPDGDMPGRQREAAAAVAASPGALAADATLARLSLARSAEVLPLAVEAAEDAGAQTAAEKMVAHQLAAAHRLGMELMAIAGGEAHKHRVAAHLHPGALAEAARTASAASRLVDVCTRAALALDRLRRGGRQVVVVVRQPAAAEAGGRAIAAGGSAAERGGSGVGGRRRGR